MNPRAIKLIAALAAIAVIGFVALQGHTLIAGLSDAPRIQHPLALVPAAALLALLPVTHALIWRRIVCAMDGIRPPLIDSLAVFCAAWAARYVPGSLLYAAGKVAMGSRLGHSRGSLIVSLVYENVIVIAVALASSCLLIPLTLAGGQTEWLMYLGGACASLALVAVLSPRLMYFGVSAVMRLLKRDAFDRRRLLSFRDLAATCSLAVVALTVNSAGFALLLGSFVDLSVKEAVATAAIFNLAGAIGIAAIPVPSGLGVREAVLIGLLQVFVPVPIATAAALLARLFGLVADGVLGALGTAVFALRQRSAPPAPAAMLAPDSSADAA